MQQTKDILLFYIPMLTIMGLGIAFFTFVNCIVWGYNFLKLHSYSLFITL